MAARSGRSAWSHAPILRYSGPPSSEPLDPYGDSEEEESEEELDSVSVVADRAGCRDRLSGD